MERRSIFVLLAAAAAFFMTATGQDRFTPTRLTDDPVQHGFPTWTPDSRSIIYQRFSWKDSLGKNGLWQVSLDTKEAKHIFSGIAEHAKLSPDGSTIVFDADTGKSIALLEVGTQVAKKFLPDSIRIFNGGLPCWSPSGTQIAFKAGTEYGLCVYDVSTGKVAEICHEEGMLELPGCWWPDGRSILVCIADRQTRKSTMWKISPDGKERQQITGHHESFWRHLAVSPDGSLLVYGAVEGRYVGLWVMPSGGGKSLPLAVTPQAHNEGPAWSPDGKRLAFSSTRSGNHGIWVMDVDVELLKKELQALNEQP